MSKISQFEFQDAIRPNNERVDEEYTAPIKYENHPNEESYGPIRLRGVEVEYSAAVESVGTLHSKKHLAAQLHQRNRCKWADLDHPNDGSTLYSLAVLEVAETALAEESLELPSSSILNRRLKVAFLEKCRCVSNQSRYYRHLENSPAVCEALGYDTPQALPSYSTVSNLHSEIPPEVFDEEQGFEAAFENAAVRAAYAAYRNGLVPPESVREAYGLNALTPAFSEKTLTRADEREALRNWVRLLKRETLDPLTFGRDDPQFTVFDFIGLLAASARDGAGLETAADVALWDYNYEQVPKGTALPKYIANELPESTGFDSYTDTDVPTVDEQFTEVHQQTMSVANDMGFFTDPVSIASDLLEIEWTGGEAPTISRYGKRMNDVTEEWTFSIVSIIDNENRFTLGVRLLEEKSEYPGSVRDILSGPTQLLDVEMMLADAGMVPGELLGVARRVADGDWIVSAPDRPPVKTLKGLTPEGYVGYAEGVKAGTVPKPNLVVYPKEATNPDVIEVTAGEIENPEIDKETIKTYQNPEETELQTRTLDDWERDSDADDSSDPSLTSAFPLPSFRGEFSDPAGMKGVGVMDTHVAFFTGRELPDRSANGVRADYFQRWAIEESINQVSNDFMPALGGSNPKIRRYGINAAVLFQNWHTMINRARSPELGYRLDVTHSELLKAIQDVAFS
ncbi:MULTISPECIES: hypothetical protein [Haloarcula]|uniref:hypothetical protein n=1 Tax=Haloarcula TaxID=2237 RepID=UPI0023EE13B1|nr:hypothetical protein [Halomicroarcula sp. XH51]